MDGITYFIVNTNLSIHATAKNLRSVLTYMLMNKCHRNLVFHDNQF